MPLTTDEKLLTLSRDVIAAFDKADGGIHPGFRPAHAKGILLTGIFAPSPDAASLTRAPHLQQSPTPVTVRFSNFAGIPTVPDNDLQGAARAASRCDFTSRSMSIPTSSGIRLMAFRRATRKGSWPFSTH
jgi:hypothetical protein